jgi:hypothetical protein
MIGYARTVFLLPLIVITPIAACSDGAPVTSDPAAAPPSGGVPAPSRLILAEPVDHLDTTAREPMLLEHPSGTLFVAGYQRENPVVEQSPALWRSDDAGSSWRRVDVGAVADGAVGNSDVDLAVAPDGTLYALTMGFDRTRGEGTHVAVGVSDDVGVTWAWTFLTQAPRVDRPWIVITSDNVAHVIWNDGEGVSYTRAAGGAGGWSEPRKIAPRGGSSHLAAGPDDELAVRVTPLSASGAERDEDADWILVSTDGGDTWIERAPPGRREFSGLGMEEEVPRWVEPVAWDAGGALYYLWSEGRELWLGRSTDRGGSWDSWVVARGEERMFYPYLVARGSGELAATWFSGAGEGLAAHVALIEVAAGGEPRVLRGSPFQPQSWAPGDPPVRDPAGEYLPVTFLASGGMAVAAPIQDPAGQRFGFSYHAVSVH